MSQPWNDMRELLNLKKEIAALRADLEKERARVKELEELYTNEIKNHTVTEGLRLKAESRLSALEKVAKYVKHIGYCNKVQRPYDHGGIFRECNCGLDAALKEVGK